MMRLEYMKAIVDRRRLARRSRSEARSSIAERCCARQDEARKTLATVSTRNSDRRASLAGQLGEMRQRRANQAAALHQSLTDGRRQRHDSVATRLDELHHETCLCGSYWSLPGGEGI